MCLSLRGWLSPTRLLLVLSLFAIAACSEPTTGWQQHNEDSSLSIDHQAWQDILDEYLIDDDPSGINLVDYESLADEALADLTDYLTDMSAVDISQYNRAQQFAYWVNIYNAITVHLIAENYPVDSIKEISEGVLPLGPWNDVVFEVNGKPLTLNNIEHDILRPIWQDYRIHFAVNCASIGCPNLQAQAFTADNSEVLLDQSSEGYLQHARGFEMRDETLYLSSIFDWYQTDFGATEQAMLDTLSRHLSPSQKAELAAFAGDTDYRYDWSLNGAG